jgi:TAP C-terminal domain
MLHFARLGIEFLELSLVNIQNTSDPEAALDVWLSETVGAGADSSEVDRFLVVAYDYAQYYLPDTPLIGLNAIYCQSDGQLYFVVAESNLSRCNQLESMDVGLPALHTFAQANDLPVFVLGNPLKLETVSIAKPWGREIWYTGIEERGISRVTDGLSSIPLSWFLSAMPRRLAAGYERKINLLKILDPLSEVVYGDLYFELHQEKREVYVVTHIDSEAWPDGVGAIRYGFNPEARKKYATSEVFRAAYLEVVKRYEVLRRQIDEQFDTFRQDEAVGSNTPISAEMIQRWSSMLPDTVLAQEESLREEMNQFTSLLPLEQGDVVQVPLLTPHSLQHGVRTVEFQTPVYERMILSFAQKVLTQNHWDTEQAVEVMSLDSPSLPELEVLEENKDFRLEEVVKFDDFQVLRLTLMASAEYVLSQTQYYGLLLVVDGEVVCQGVGVAKEEALLLPAKRSELQIANCLSKDAVLLLAAPV